MVKPSEGYHGIRFYETFGDFGFITKCRLETLRTLGPSLSPFNAWTFLQGLETLHLRMERHVENAKKVADYLNDHSLVKWVNYAGLENNRYADLAEKYLPKGAGSILTFGIKGGKEAGIKFIENAKITKKIAGKKVIHHSPENKKSLPSLINVPKEGVVGGTPTPKKLKVDSAKIARANPIVPITNTGLKIFGKICLNIIIIFETPIIVDAET